MIIMDSDVLLATISTDNTEIELGTPIRPDSGSRARSVSSPHTPTAEDSRWPRSFHQPPRGSLA